VGDIIRIWSEADQLGRMLVPYAFEGIGAWLQRLDRFALVVERTKGAR
jgi:hypothetical protein